MRKKPQSMFPDGDTIFMDGSSTVRRIIKHLNNFENLKIITNNCRIFKENVNEKNKAVLHRRSFCQPKQHIHRCGCGKLHKNRKCRYLFLFKSGNIAGRHNKRCVRVGNLPKKGYAVPGEKENFSVRFVKNRRRKNIYAVFKRRYGRDNLRRSPSLGIIRQKNVLFAFPFTNCITGPETITVTIVHIPNFPPSKTPATTIITSRIIRTALTGRLFLSAMAKVTASYEPLPRDAEAYKPVPAANKTTPASIIKSLSTRERCKHGILRTNPRTGCTQPDIKSCRCEFATCHIPPQTKSLRQPRQKKPFRCLCEMFRKFPATKQQVLHRRSLRTSQA